jgi:hypothetical protein
MRKKKTQENGGIFIIFLAFLPILITLILFTINNLQASLLYKRLCQAVDLYTTQKQLAYNLIACNHYGIISSNISKTEEETINGTLIYKPFFSFSNENIHFEYSQKIISKSISIIALLDVFVDQNHMDRFQKLMPFIEAFKEIAQTKNINLKIVPYAGSINIGKEKNDLISFESHFPKNIRLAKKILDFEKLSPYQAILKNKKSDLKLGNHPNIDCWSGCIALKNPYISFEEQLTEKFKPYFYASTFGKRYIDDTKNLLRKNHPVLGSLGVTGDNNWTNRTIRESREDYQLYGGFVLGPNIGCPSPIIEDPHSFESSLYPVTRGGSMLPLAFEYAHYLLKEDKNPKIIIIVKSSPVLFYDWEGPFINLITESTGFPGLPKTQIHRSDYSAYGNLSDQNIEQSKIELEEKLLDHMKDKIELFKNNKGHVLSFYLDQIPSIMMEMLYTQSTEYIPFQETFRTQEIIDFIQNFLIRLNFSGK